MTKMKINEAARTIEMTKMFYRAACQFGTEEYKMLRGQDAESKEIGIESLSYQEMKAWFLDKFPAIREYHEKREKLLNAVAEREAKRKEKLKAKKTVA